MVTFYGKRVERGSGGGWNDTDEDEARRTERPSMNLERDEVLLVA